MEGKILVVDDDPALNELLTIKLSALGHLVYSAVTGKEALRKAFELQPDLVLLDVRMPGMDGFETVQKLRKWSTAPVLMLTGQAEKADVLRGFRLGADDYVRKPFDWDELECRIQALLNRTRMKGESIQSLYDDGFLRIDLDRREVFRQGKRVHLTSTEFSLLENLARHPGAVIPYNALLSQTWGPAYTENVNTLFVYIRYLRRKLENNPQRPAYIRNHWGSGYSFTPVNSYRDAE